MPTVKHVENTIQKKEGVKVKFRKGEGGKDVRSDANLPVNYITGKATKNSASVSYLKNKLQKQFPGYDFYIENAEKKETKRKYFARNSARYVPR